MKWKIACNTKEYCEPTEAVELLRKICDLLVFFKLLCDFWPFFTQVRLKERVRVISLYFRSHMPTVNILVIFKAALDTQQEGGGRLHNGEEY
jgi:hypothetical protein